MEDGWPVQDFMLELLVANNALTLMANNCTNSYRKIDKFYIFITPLHLNVTLFSKSPYLAACLKIYYETGRSGEFSEKHTDAHPESSQHLRQRSFVALVSSFQLLTNFSKNSILGVVGVLNLPLEYYNIF